MNLERIKLIIRNRNFIPVAIFIVMDIIMLAFALYLGVTVSRLLENKNSAEAELESKRGTATLIQSNQSALTSSIEDYNDALNQLIPDEETYFNMIAAFEKLAEETGIQVGSYTINLDQTTEQKLSLELSVEGDQEALLRLLRDYNYASGRLLTNEQVDINLDNASSLSFSINLFHAETSLSGVDTSTQINSEDIQFMEEVIQKIR